MDEPPHSVTGNSATWGGGVDVGSGTVRLVNSIVAGNLSETGTDDCNGIGGPITSDGFNLFGENTGCPAGANDRVVRPDEVAMFIGPLAENGGSTKTHALLPEMGNPAVDGGDPSGCFSADGTTLLTTDQRGQPRPSPVGGLCDIGAYELQLDASLAPVGGRVFGVDVERGWVWCINATINQVVKIPLGNATSYNCEAAGLTVNPGDWIKLGMFVKGQALGYSAEGVFQDAATAIVPEQTMERASSRLKDLILKRIAED